MKVGLVFQGRLDSGGGFNQSLSAIKQALKIADSADEYVILTDEIVNIERLSAFGVSVHFISENIFDKLFRQLSHFEFFRRWGSKSKFTSSYEKKLINMGIELIYFLSPNQVALNLQRINYIFTVWDMCHRDHPEFPEVREYFEYQIRDDLYRNTLGRAFAVVADSAQLAKNITQWFGITQDKIIVMPFSPNMELNPGREVYTSWVREKYNLKDEFVLYPAQFWAHKNHVRIVQALAMLGDGDLSLSAVFAGGDKGTKSHVMSCAKKLGVDNRIYCLGFVKNEDLIALYAECKAVVMPSYFGPTNIPPLEAWLFNKPLICSDTMAEQVGAGAFLINPDDPKELKNSLIKLQEEKQLYELLECGRQRLAQIQNEREDSEKKLQKQIQVFRSRRECWAQL